VWDEAGTATVAAGTAVTISSTVFDTLQTGTVWDEDSTGYNFRHLIAAAAFPTPGLYTVEYKFTLTSGRVFQSKGLITVLSIAAS
jgi:hypothetical protein